MSKNVSCDTTLCKFLPLFEFLVTYTSVCVLCIQLWYSYAFELIWLHTSINQSINQVIQQKKD